MMRCREFFFVRHGQTDHNTGKIQGEHGDIRLNTVGLAQAEAIEPFIATLPLRVVFYSPMQRARETKDIITRRISTRCLEIPEFTECPCSVWEEIRQGSAKGALAKQFMERVKDGLQKVLVEEGPALIVAHGGVYSAIFTWLNLKGGRIIDNCIPMRFFLNPKGYWSVTGLDYILDGIQ